MVTRIQERAARRAPIRRGDYFGSLERPSNLYAHLAILTSMDNVFITFHQFQLLRLLSILVVFGVLVPGLVFIVRAVSWLVARFARLGRREARQPTGQTS
jgi:hypothetical protein